MSGLLGYIVASLTDRREDTATEALAFVLKSRVARNALAEFLGAGLGAPVQVAQVRTQKHVDKKARPDLLTYDSDFRVSAFLEAKLWAELTEAQPGEYLRRLEQEGGRMVLFLVPDTRVESILLDLADRAKKAGVKLGPWTVHGSFRRAEAPGSRALVVTSWTALLGALRLECSKAGEADSVASLVQLAGLVEQFEADSFIPLAPTELSDFEAPRRIVSIINVVESGIQAAISAETVTTKGKSEQGSRHSTGRYVYFPEAKCWVGVDLKAWIDLQVSPAWVYFYASDCDVASVKKALKSWEMHSPPRLYAYGQAQVAVPLFLQVGRDEGAVVADLASQIASIGNALRLNWRSRN